VIGKAGTVFPFGGAGTNHALADDGETRRCQNPTLQDLPFADAVVMIGFDIGPERGLLRSAIRATPIGRDLANGVPEAIAWSVVGPSSPLRKNIPVHF
jgi:hypothetical protein